MMLHCSMLNNKGYGYGGTCKSDSYWPAGRPALFALGNRRILRWLLGLRFSDKAVIFGVQGVRRIINASTNFDDCFSVFMPSSNTVCDNIPVILVVVDRRWLYFGHR